MKDIGLLNTITLPKLRSSATALLIQHTLEHTKHIRVGSAGIMLPNHAPLIVAKSLTATLFPNRVDLGLGRAPGTDMMTASALRRDQHDGVYKFPEEVSLLQQYLALLTNKHMFVLIQQ